MIERTNKIKWASKQTYEKVGFRQKGKKNERRNKQTNKQRKGRKKKVPDFPEISLQIIVITWYYINTTINNNSTRLYPISL